MTTTKTLKAGTVIWTGKRPVAHTIRSSRRLSNGTIVYIDRNGIAIPATEITKVGT